MGLASAAAVVVFSVWLGQPGAMGPGLVGAAILWWLLREWGRRGGPAFLRDGFVRCPGCDWARSGDREGREVRDALARGGALFAAAFFAFLLPALFFWTVHAVSRWREAQWWFGGLVWGAMAAAFLRDVYRPDQHARPSRRRPPPPPDA